MNMIIEKLIAHAEADTNRIALVIGESAITYSDLSQMVDAFTVWLVEQRVKTLGFKLDNSLSWVVCDLAALKAGINCVPIPMFFTSEQTNHIVEAGSVDCLIVSGDLLHIDKELDATWHSCESAIYCLRAALKHDGFNIKVFAKEGTQKHGLKNTKLTFTSGSTGEAKGVCLSNEKIVLVAQSIVSAMEHFEIESHLCLLPLATLLENIAGLYAPIIKGITIHVPLMADVGLDGSSLDVEKFARILNEVNPNSIILVPQLLTALVALKQFELVTVDGFEMIAVGGGRVSQHLLAAAHDQNLPVCQGYGLSECCSVLTLNLDGKSKLGSVGKALSHAELRINSSGEIEAKGGNMLGYLVDGKLCESSTEGGWYDTGDLGYIDDNGFVYITGRVKNMFITSFGRNVNPEWVESALSQQAAISLAIVYGEAKDHNFALLWLRFPTDDQALITLVATANKELPNYAQAHEFMVMDEDIPISLMTANGRLKRAAVLQHYAPIIESHYAAKLARIV